MSLPFNGFLEYSLGSRIVSNDQKSDDMLLNEATFRMEFSQETDIAAFNFKGGFRYDNYLDDVEISVREATIDLYAYEKMSVRTLLEAILIPSANDAARALAIFDAGSEEAFVEKMNQKAKALNLDSATFYNATGLDIQQDCQADDVTCDSQFYGNEMSAQDLMLLSRILLKNPFFRATVQKRNFEGTSVDGKFFHEKPSTNKLFDHFIVSKGIKTGYTELAGECFINLSETENQEEIITIVLGSSDRFGETANLVSWILDSYQWR